MNAIVNYKGKDITYHDLILGKHNMDKFIMQKNVFKRPDHDFGFMVDSLQPGDVVYDIGAYIGTFAIPFALEGMEVHAFEGFPGNYERLKKNCEPYNNITVHNIAVNNETRKTKTQFNSCTGVPEPVVDVNYHILDDYIKDNNIPLPKLIKLDIEGMETVALFGMTNLLETVKPLWQIGYHHNAQSKYSDYPGFVTTKNGGFDFSTFNKLGYKVHEHRGSSKPFSIFADYYCIPE